MASDFNDTKYNPVNGWIIKLKSNKHKTRVQKAVIKSKIRSWLKCNTKELSSKDQFSVVQQDFLIYIILNSLFVSFLLVEIENPVDNLAMTLQKHVFAKIKQKKHNKNKGKPAWKFKKNV